MNKSKAPDYDGGQKCKWLNYYHNTNAVSGQTKGQFKTKQTGAPIAGVSSSLGGGRMLWEAENWKPLPLAQRVGTQKMPRSLLPLRHPAPARSRPEQTPGIQAQREILSQALFTGAGLF